MTDVGESEAGGQSEAVETRQIPATMEGRNVVVRREGAVAFGAVAIGVLALGAAAVGALAIGSLAIGQLGVGRPRLRKGRVDELRTTRLTVGELWIEHQQNS